MLIDMKHLSFPMKMVFLLSEELKNNPDRINRVQALTMNESKPLLGLKGSHGLFGSLEWWSNIEGGGIPLVFVSGRILRAYAAGQDPLPINNTVDVINSDGEVQSVGIYINDPMDVDMFLEGHWLEIVYALDELKDQPARDGSVNYSKIALEVAVSLHAI